MLPSDSMIDGGWQSVEVAAGQRALVEAELARDPATVAPYAALLAVLDSLRMTLAPDVSLLDVGCGVGHYGTLLRRYRPRIRYRGTDSSLPMIAIARQREPDLSFNYCDIRDNDWQADIILLSQVVEVTPNPLGYAARVLNRSRASYLIWHRVRLTGRSGFVDEPTYAGRRGPIWRWAMSDLTGLLELARRRYLLYTWPGREDMLTVTLFPEKPDVLD